jgi:OFA family oxalate/formate antiporter-like MFS transporter
MLVAFGIEGVGIYCLYLWGADPVWFVLLSGLVFFAWGEIYSLFPSTATDTFGSKFATTNAGLLYTAKGTAALLVPYASTIQKTTGSWDLVFIIAAGANILAAVLAIAVLKPWRARVIDRSSRGVGLEHGEIAAGPGSGKAPTVDEFNALVRRLKELEDENLRLRTQSAVAK